MNCAVSVFARAPVAGAVKTRLIPAIGAEGAAALHARLVRHSLAIAVEANLGPVSLCCDPVASHPFFTGCAREFGVALHVQQGADLGARMAAALRAALEEAAGAIVIGSDCPSLTADDLRRAAAALAAHDAVLGPAEDGGYVLVGLRRSLPALFDDIEWGTSSVLEQTRARLRAAGAGWFEIETRWDVDRPQDLGRLESVGVSLEP
jgi:rSAM/selenodomain-associated transferase 1